MSHQQQQHPPQQQPNGNVAAAIPVHCEPLDKTIKVGVQLKNASAHSEAAVSAGMLRALIEGRFGKDAALTTAEGTAIPDGEIIWARDNAGEVSVRPHLHVTRSRSGSSEPQQSSKTAITPSPEQQQRRRDDDAAQHQAKAAAAPAAPAAQKPRPPVNPADVEIAQRVRQLHIAQALLETDRVRWAQQLDVLRSLRDLSLQVLQAQRSRANASGGGGGGGGGTSSSASASEPTLEELAVRLTREQQVADAAAQAQQERHAEVRDAEMLLEGLQRDVAETLAAAGVSHEKPQYADAPAFLRESLLNLALRRVQLAQAAAEIGQRQRQLDALRRERRATVEQAEARGGNVRVVVRQRPYIAELDGAQPRRLGPAEVGEVLADEEQRCVRVFSPATGPREFEFVRVFHGDVADLEAGARSAQQTQLFDDEVVPLLREAIAQGTDACVLMYGPTGSGKTYSVFGAPAEPDCPGILELALAEIVQFSGDADVQASELYLDQRTDLLDPAAAAAAAAGREGSQQPRSPSGVSASVESSSAASDNCCWIRVKTVQEALRLVRRAAQRRVTARTLTNDVSSRSHMLIRVRFPIITGRNITVTFADLAGSERVGRSLSTGDRLKEAQHINRSLAALGDVVAALAGGGAHIPYRNSKLTMLLQGALGGRSRTLLMLCVPPHLPEQHNMSEIVSALTFGARARAVRNSTTKASK